MAQWTAPTFLLLSAALSFTPLVASATADATQAGVHHGHRHHHARIDPGEPQLRSNAVLVLDATHAQVLYSRRADQPRPIASITKLLTALVVADAGLPLTERLSISREDVASGRGAFSRLAVGTELTRGDLMHLALMSSENRAAHALARTYPGGVPAFVEAMNAKAKALGMSNSHFVDPTGLSSENMASAEDLSRLVAAAADNEIVREYSTDPGYAVRIGRRMVQFHNTDALVSNPTWNIVVQKTGYITEAGRCLVMQAVIEGRTVVMVLLNSFGKNTRVADARRIRRWMETTLARSSGLSGSKA